MKKQSALTIAGAGLCVMALTLGACGGSGGSDSSAKGTNGGSSNAVISVFNPEPANPLIPSMTNEVGGGNPIDVMFSKLVRFDDKGKPVNEIAKQIKANEDNTQYTVTINDGWKFSDGTPVTAQSFTKAWSWASSIANKQLGSSFFANIKGYDDLQKEGTPSDAQLSGLKVIDNKTFTVDLTSPSSTFPIQVGYTAFAPLPESFYKDTKAFGEKPVTVGPYKFQSWEHNKSIKVVKDPAYKGGVKVKNGGVEFRSYTDATAAYRDVQAGNLDVLDTLPASARKTFQTDNTVQAINDPGSVIQMFTIPTYMKHFGQDEEGHLRRQAISMSIDRPTIIKKVLSGTAKEVHDFTAPVIPGYSTSIKGSDVLKYNPSKAKELWAEANKISPWSEGDTFKIAYNADGAHKEIYDAVTNSIKNALGIQAAGNPLPTFSEFRSNVQNRKFTDSAFRSGWQPDYPSPESYLSSNFASSAANGNGSNDGDYKNPEFDGLMDKAASAKSIDEANKIYQQSEELLFRDLPAVPLYYQNSNGVAAKNVQGFSFNWKGVPAYYNISK
ncbi:ABC transporter substrate-binding protein [Bifidobacterium sp. B4107]|uniref:peptide ABC transporter substrate-binding protein n=1 Tax=unclassified Bifidobacterium TaxID=2608897 RepID=UPI00226B992E|nr:MULTISPECIES: ABC transporter substrate-binding protein [unclassified Bifidobacterium]MCX8648018.1 ABC transporter substrate-binding protein [Bifidobacterium sp. B4107]MCX8652375.1 ABC transporter substrate-binding protein [Bifidobacterium sp. B4111]MCX8658935.1 ABC transporter substrate-binding protein [Bifidobacterium sp. B4114]